MALFGMFKKKENAVIDAGQLKSDLPPIDGSGLPPLAGDLELPSLDIPDVDLPPLQQGNIPPPTFNVPPLDFSMPSPDSDSSNQNMGLPDSPNSKLNSLNDVDENLNKLFLSEEWKEPDWNTFDPYTDPQIDEPSPGDFGLTVYESGPEEQQQSDQESYQQTGQQSDQQFDQQQTDEMPVPDFNDNSTPVEIEPLEIERENKPVPIELFVKGSDYRNVFSELSRINSLLSSQDPKITMMQDLTKKENEDLLHAKENMEFVYRKFMLVDKKIFA